MTYGRAEDTNLDVDAVGASELNKAIIRGVICPDSKSSRTFQNAFFFLSFWFPYFRCTLLVGQINRWLLKEMINLWNCYHLWLRNFIRSLSIRCCKRTPSSVTSWCILSACTTSCFRLRDINMMVHLVKCDRRRWSPDCASRKAKIEKVALRSNATKKTINPTDFFFLLTTTATTTTVATAVAADWFLLV